LTHRVYNGARGEDWPFAAELRAELGRELSAAQATLLLRLFRYWEEAPEKPWLGQENKWMRKVLIGAAKRGGTRQEARVLAELCAAGGFQEQALALVRAVLRKDPQDPLFRLFEHSLRNQGPYGRPQSRWNLESILAEARQRGDQEAIQRAERDLRALEQPPPPPRPEFDDFQEPGGPEGDLEEELPPEFGDFPGGAPPPDEVRRIMAMLAEAPPEVIAELRKAMVPHMPAMFFDLLIKAAKTGQPPPFLPGPLFPSWAGPPKVPRTSPARPRRDPNQNELI
jgi:hypothetical protein